MSSGTGSPVVKSEPGTNSRVPPAAKYDYFPLKACTEQDIEETRYHILKFHSVKKVNLQKDFEEPTRLHRKDPKNLQFQLSLKELEQKKIDDKKRDIMRAEKRMEYLKKRGLASSDLTEEQIDENIEMETLTEEERTRREEFRKRQEDEARRLAKKEADLSIVAPDGGARKTKKQLLKKKTRQIKVYDEQKRRLRYEEFYPWVLEDYDAKQAWVGNYEAGNTENYCLLVLDNQNKCFKMIPVEKFYKFTSRNKYATLTLEEAEAKMREGNSSSRWLMKRMQEEAARGERVDLRYRKMKTTSAVGEDDVKRSDEETLDFDEEFQDDEEAPILEGNDEESKLVEKKMKTEMLRANNLIEPEVEDDELDDLFEVRKIDKEGRKLRNALVKNAMNEVYDTDDEENPYLSESDLEEEEEKKEGEGVVKEEEKEEGVPETKESNTRSEARISVKSCKDGLVVLKASKQILSEFPAGDWNPGAIKREPSEVEQPPLKKIKIKLERAEEDVPVGASTTPITKADVDALLTNGPISLKLLVREFKHKVSADPSNRDVLKGILKQHFALRNNMVYRKE